MDEETKLKRRLEDLEKKYREHLFEEAEGLETTEEKLEEPKEFEEVEESEETGHSFETKKAEKIEKPKVETETKPKEKKQIIKNLVNKIKVKKSNSEETNNLEDVSDYSDLELPEIEDENENKSYQEQARVPLIIDNRPNEEEIKIIAQKIQKMKEEIGKVIIGQDEIIDGLIMGLLCDAHVLVEGVPGIAKTLAIRALASVTGCDVKRIQFTVDMLPTDIIGITNYTPEKGFEVIKGPVFANFVIADEINRAPPKTQSALMEAMQEKQVTIGKERFALPLPFFVMATENPIENAGVYPLPEAQVDRFLLKLIMTYPEIEEEKEVLETNITLRRFEEFNLKPTTSPKEIVKMQQVVKRVYLDDNIKNYILQIVKKTRDKDFPNAEYISYGSSPRASIGLFIASKARALMQGRNYVLPEDVKAVVFDVLRHRLILSYKASIQKISPDSIIREIIDLVKVD